MIEIEIDLNVRTAGNGTYAGFADVRGDATALSVGDAVTVVEPESGLRGEATVRSLDANKRIVYLDVAWTGMREPRSDGSLIVTDAWQLRVTGNRLTREIEPQEFSLASS